MDLRGVQARMVQTPLPKEKGSIPFAALPFPFFNFHKPSIFKKNEEGTQPKYSSCPRTRRGLAPGRNHGRAIEPG